MKVGIDLVKIGRISKLEKREDFLNKIFCDEELEYYKQKGQSEETLAGIFACKEAFLKAIGNGVFNGINLSEIKILHKNFGQPYLELSNEIKENFKVKKTSISISHDGEYATAICIIY